MNFKKFSYLFCSLISSFHYIVGSKLVFFIFLSRKNIFCVNSFVRNLSAIHNKEFYFNTNIKDKKIWTNDKELNIENFWKNDQYNFFLGDFCDELRNFLKIDKNFFLKKILDKSGNLKFCLLLEKSTEIHFLTLFPARLNNNVIEILHGKYVFRCFIDKDLELDFLDNYDFTFEEFCNLNECETESFKTNFFSKIGHLDKNDIKKGADLKNQGTFKIKFHKCYNFCEALFKLKAYNSDYFFDKFIFWYTEVFSLRAEKALIKEDLLKKLEEFLDKKMKICKNESGYKEIEICERSIEKCHFFSKNLIKKLESILEKKKDFFDENSKEMNDEFIKKIIDSFDDNDLKSICSKIASLKDKIFEFEKKLVAECLTEKEVENLNQTIARKLLLYLGFFSTTCSSAAPKIGDKLEIENPAILNLTEKDFDLRESPVEKFQEIIQSLEKSSSPFKFIILAIEYLNFVEKMLKELEKKNFHKISENFYHLNYSSLRLSFICNVQTYNLLKEQLETKKCNIAYELCSYFEKIGKKVLKVENDEIILNKDEIPDLDNDIQKLSSKFENLKKEFGIIFASFDNAEDQEDSTGSDSKKSKLFLLKILAFLKTHIENSLSKDSKNFENEKFYKFIEFLINFLEKDLKKTS